MTKHQLARAILQAKQFKIDPEITPLILEMWAHGYETEASCQGGGPPHSEEAYVAYREKSGDGWFEEHAAGYGLTRSPLRPCCLMRCVDNIHLKFCGKCGSGVHGRVTYRGKLKEPA